MFTQKRVTIIILLFVVIVSGAGAAKYHFGDVDMHGKPKVQQTK